MVSEAIKAWIVANYGDGTRVTSDGWRKLNVAVMNNTVAAPYSKADITEAVVMWAMDNPNYTVSGTPPVTPPITPPATGVSEAIKAWIVANYGDGTRVTSDGWRKLNVAVMNNTVAAPYSKADITEAVVLWAMDNPNYTVSGTPPVTPPVTPIATIENPGTLAVTAKDSVSLEEVDWGLVRLRSETAKSGGKYVGILPYVGEVEAKTYQVVVTARGYTEGIQKATVRKNQRTNVSISLVGKTFASVLKIVEGGPAYIDGISFKEFEVMFVGEERSKDWTRVETTVVDTFQARMTWYHHQDGVDVSQLTKATELFGAARGVLHTEKKILSPDMSSTERHLDFPVWDIPSAPGYYRVTFGLLMG